MDLIGSIKLIENTLGGRYSDQTKRRSSSQHKHHDSAQDYIQEPDHQPSTAWDEIQLGRNIDTTA